MRDSAEMLQFEHREPNPRRVNGHSVTQTRDFGNSTNQPNHFHGPPRSNQQFQGSSSNQNQHWNGQRNNNFRVNEEISRLRNGHFPSRNLNNFQGNLPD